MKKNDGKTEVWRNPEDISTDAEIIISGDWAPIRKFSPVIERNALSIYGDLLETLRDADLRITNLEAALAGEKPQVKSGSVFKGSAEHVKGLTAPHFDLVTLANNHVFDYGLEGFAETRRLLKNNSIDFVGAGLSGDEAYKPFRLKLKGIEIAIVNFSEGEDLTKAESGYGVAGWEIEKITTIIKELRNQVDVIIVIAHAGLEYVPFPPPYVVRAFDRIAEAGADLIAGHHPHVPQGMKVSDNTPIYYSLGNFVFYQDTSLYYRKLGYMLKVGISKSGISRIEVIPYNIDDNGLSGLKGKSRKNFFRLFADLSKPLNIDSDADKAWNAFLKYYGINGLKKEISMIMDKVDEDPAKAAAMFRNRLTTMQHHEHWMTFLNRLTAGKLDEAPDWAFNMCHEYFSREVMK